MAATNDRVRAYRLGPTSVLFGLGSARPQQIDDLPEQVVDDVVRLEPQTPEQWAAVVRRRTGSAQSARLVERAARTTLTPPARRLVVRVLGDGPVTEAIRDAARTIGLQCGGPETDDLPDVVVCVGAPGACLRHHDSRWHLLVELGADQVVVGPFLREGQAPCVGCLHLRRRDLVPQWPRLVTQVQGLSLAEPEPSVPHDVRLVAVGLTALALRAVATGRPWEPDLALSMSIPDPVLHQHYWPAHPMCSCQHPLPDDAQVAL